MMDEAEPQKVRKQFEIGQDLSTLSIEELAETIELLRSEIERLGAAKSAKSAQMEAAESLFKTNE